MTQYVKIGPNVYGPVPEATPARDTRPQEEFLKVAEVATRLRVSPMTVYRLIHSRELAAIRVGRTFRVPAGAVDAYLKSNEVTP